MEDWQEDYSYLLEKDNKYLVQYIEEMLDFEGVQKAILILKRRGCEKALELTLDIIENDKGDHHLQGFACSLFFDEHGELFVQALMRRKAPIEYGLMLDIMDGMSCCYPDLSVPRELLQRMAETYATYTDREKENMSMLCCDYEDFAKKYLTGI